MAFKTFTEEVIVKRAGNWFHNNCTVLTANDRPLSVFLLKTGYLKCKFVYLKYLE